MDITGKRKTKHSKIVLGIIIPLYTLLVIYFGLAVYFMNHFYFGSEINGINVSGISVENVKELMTSELQAYKLDLKERDGKSEQIGAAEVGVKYNPDGQFENFKDKQNPFKWISALFHNEDSKTTIAVSYDEKLLKERVDKLSCFDSSNIIEPKNPSYKYIDSGYIIVEEVNGNKVNKGILYDEVANSILKKEPILDLESIDCYVKPQYTSKSQKVIEVKDMLNKYVSSKITYTFGEHKEILDGSTINEWIVVDENYGVVLDETKAKDYMDVFANNYSEVGNMRNFVTSSGKTIDIHGGDYSCLINTAKEVQDLSAAIKEGKVIAKEPTYVQTAYVEIDLTKQHLWFYKNGSLIVQGDIVSGNLDSSHATPGGIYELKYKKRNAILRGPGYAAPVDFWMPFNGGIGIHDAVWRGRFGGNIYKGDGSHGCINCPYNLAATIFDNIEEGTPVICYY